MLIDIGDSGSLLFRHISIEQVFSYNFNLLLLSMILHLINEMPSLTVVTPWYTTTGRRTLGSPTQPAPPLLPTQRAHSRAVHIAGRSGEIITFVTQHHCQCQCQHSSTTLKDIYTCKNTRKKKVWTRVHTLQHLRCKCTNR